MSMDYAPNKYKIIEKIGEGVHGLVFKAINLELNKVVAIKKVGLKTKHGDILLNTIREIKTLQHCQCENIIKLFDIFPDVTGLGLVLEFMPFTLYSRLRDSIKPISKSTGKSYMHMLISGLKYMHNLGIMHRDIKPANLLINECDILKIADFGLSRLYDHNESSSYSPQVASRWYRAPEILWGSSQYGPTIDMWAVGCILAELLRNGVPLFSGNSDIEQLALVIKTLGSPTVKDWPEMKSLPDYKKIRFPNAKREKWENIFPGYTTKEEMNLVNELLKYNPQKRLTAVQALSHEYFHQTMR